MQQERLARPAVVVGDGLADRRDGDVVGVAADLLVQAEQQRRGQAGDRELVADGDRLRQPDDRALGRQGPGQRDVADVLVVGLAVAAPGPVLVGAIGAGGLVEHAAPSQMRNSGAGPVFPAI